MDISILSDMYIKVKIIAGTRKETVEKVSEDHFNISLREKAENNRANNRLLEIMHEEYKDSIIKIISGHHSPSKILSIDSKSIL